ncbi:MAG: glycosyltransferase [Acidimicrobiia bacterium]
MRILLFGTYDRERHPRVEVLREGLEAKGDLTGECNVPLGLDTAERIRLLRRPLLLPRLAVSVGRQWYLLLRRARRTRRPDLVLVGYMGHFDIHLAKRLWRHTPVALDHLISAKDTAEDRGSSSAILLRLLSCLDRSALNAADVVLVDTEEHLALLPERSRDKTLVVSVGAPLAWFKPPVPDSRPRLKVVFFGLYTPLQGAPTIGKAIAQLSGEPIDFTMVGAGQDLEKTRAEVGDNRMVRWYDWVGHDALIELVQDHDVCLGIFGTTPKARRVVPNKVFQGAAAGCAIVTSNTPPQRRALGPAGIFVPTGDPGALAAALQALAEEPYHLMRSREMAYERASQAFRPEIVVEPLRRWLALDQARTRSS